MVRQPSSFAAIWARRSPRTWSGARTLARITSHTGRTGRPAVTSFVGGMRSPSSKTSVVLAPK